MRVLVSGYYGFGNLGDEALFQGLNQGLKERGHEVSVLSSSPDKSRALHSVKAYHRLYGLLPALLQTDALISGGGGLLQDKTSSRSLDYYLGVIRLARSLGKRVVIYGQSVGPLSDRGKAKVAQTLSGLAVGVRDKRSQIRLHKLGIESHLVADAALLLEPPRTSPSPETVLLIPRHGYPHLTQALAETGSFLSEQGFKLAALAIQPEEDAAALEQLNQSVPDLSLLQAVTPDDALQKVASASYIISARLHGLVFAALAHRNFAGLVYDPKVTAFLEEAGAPAFHQPVKLDELKRVALAQPEVSLERLVALKERAEAGLTWLYERLDERPR